MPTIIENTDSLLPFRFKYKWGFIDATARVVVEPLYTLVPAKIQSTDYPIPVALGNRKLRFGYISPRGEVLCPIELQHAGEYDRCGHATCVNHGKHFVLGPAGNVVLTPDVDDLESFLDGRAPAMRKGMWGLIDILGNWIVNPVYDFLASPKEGLIRAKKNGVWVFLDSDGKAAFRIAVDDAQDFSEGMARVKWAGDVGVADVGFIDKSGTIVLACRFYECGWFSEGLASARLLGGQYGFIDKNGVFRIAPVFLHANEFSEGLAGVHTKEGNGYVDLSGKLFAIEACELSYKFSFGVALVLHDDGSAGYIDRKGAVVFWP